MTAPQELAAATTRLTAALAEFAALIEGLDPERGLTPGACGRWSVRDVIAHHAGWDLEAARRIRASLAGPLADIDYDLDAFNAGSVAARAGFTWAGAIADWQSARARLVEAVRAIGPDDYATIPRLSGWLAGRRNDYEAHTAGIRRWHER